MKILFLLLTSILLPASELAVYTNDSFRFEVQFPKQHQEESQLQEEKFGTIEYIRLNGQEAIQVGELEGTLVYTVVASRYQGGEGLKRSGMKLQDFVFDYAKHINEESFLNNNFIILLEKHKKDALYYVVGDESMEFITHRKVFIRNEMTYSLSIMSRSKLLTQEHIDSFFNSLKIK